MTRARYWQVMGWAALAVAVSAGAVAAAAPAGPPQNAVTITILGIHATKAEKESIDPTLQPIADELRRSKFNCFRLVVSDTRSVPLKTPWEQTLIEGYALRVEPQAEADDNVTIILSWLQITKDEKGKPKATERQKVTLAIRKGKYLLSGGWKLKDGALMAAIAVK